MSAPVDQAAPKAPPGQLFAKLLLIPTLLGLLAACAPTVTPSPSPTVQVPTVYQRAIELCRQTPTGTVTGTFTLEENHPLSLGDGSNLDVAFYGSNGKDHTNNSIWIGDAPLPPQPVPVIAPNKNQNNKLLAWIFLADHGKAFGSETDGSVYYIIFCNNIKT